MFGNHPTSFSCDVSPACHMSGRVLCWNSAFSFFAVVLFADPSCDCEIAAIFAANMKTEFLPRRYCNNCNNVPTIDSIHDFDTVEQLRGSFSFDWLRKMRMLETCDDIDSDDFGINCWNAATELRWSQYIQFMILCRGFGLLFLLQLLTSNER